MVNFNAMLILLIVICARSIPLSVYRSAAIDSNVLMSFNANYITLFSYYCAMNSNALLMHIVEMFLSI